MKTIGIGKYRGLQKCSTPKNTISVLALDHRQNLRHAMFPQDPSRVTDKEMISFKKDVVEHVSDAASAVLLDPEYGLAQCIHSNSIPHGIGLLATLEETGYTGNSDARIATILPGWSVTKARRMGADAVKLLIYYHPDAASAAQIESLVREISKDCHKADILFFLETLSYSIEPNKPKLSPEERTRVVLETAKRLSPLGIDIFKAEFPVDVNMEKDETEWGKACAELTKASEVPWVLLSASVPFETFLRQTTVACQEGASGVAVGRAVWQEAVPLKGDSRREFLRAQAHERMEQVTEICTRMGHPWTETFTLPAPNVDWYKSYAPESSN
jgi:tagatose 1,6-diphosphate aldolase